MPAEYSEEKKASYAKARNQGIVKRSLIGFTQETLDALNELQKETGDSATELVRKGIMLLGKSKDSI